MTFDTIELQDFDLWKGLKKLSEDQAHLGGIANGPRGLRSGRASIEVPKGRLSVEGVRELKSVENKTRWQITISYSPKEEPKEGRVDLEGVLLPKVSFDRNAKWNSFEIPRKGGSFLLETPYLDRAPERIRLSVITGTREHEIPFTFADVAFRDY